jgi:hypothetical protein
VVPVPRIPGYDEVVEWFGRWPSFHDAEVLELHLDRSGPSWVKLHVWLMTNKINVQGQYVQEKHATVTFKFENVTNLNLADFSSQNVIFGLNLERRETGYRLELSPCYGLAGYLEAERISVTVAPGKPANQKR